MEQSQRRTESFANVKHRITRLFAHRLDDKQVLQLAVACAMREPDDVVGFLFPAPVAKAAAKLVAESALTPDEWCDIFGIDLNPLRDGGITKAVQSSEFQGPIESIGAALRMTVSESQQGVRWKRAWNRALCYVASHLDEPKGALESVIGTVVRSDYRRLEELHGQMDDDGYDTMLMSKIIIALSDSVL